MIMDLNKLARIFYNLIVPLYDPFFGSGTPIVREMRQRLVERLDLKNGFKVLEVAVGTGANLSYIAKRIGQGEIYGLDISEGMLARCRSNMRKEGIKARLVLGKAEDLPYRDNSFDAVLGFGAINFIPDKKKAIDEMIRVARPGAKIVMGDELFPFFDIFKPPMGLLPKGVRGRLSYEKVLFATFWVVEFRKG